MYIDIVEIWFGIVNGQILSYFDRVISVDLFLDDSLSTYQLIFTKLCMCINIVEIWFGIANGQILSVFDRVICPSHVSILVVG